jgi:hypothetical protein
MHSNPARRNTLLLLVLIAALGAAGFWLFQDGLARLFPDLLRTELTIRWTTENEIDVAGYNLYRAATADSAYVKVNTAPIPPSTDPFISTEHVFVDDLSIVRGRTYYYMLETVDRSGGSEREGPFAIRAD